MPGFIASTPAMATRRFCPPESSKGDFSRISSPRPTWESASRTRVFTVSSSRPRLRGPKPTSFSTVSSKSWYSGYWNTSPTSRRISMRLWPLLPHVHAADEHVARLGADEALRWAMSVDLPLPVWPMTPTKSPSRMVRETSSSARVSKGVPAYRYGSAPNFDRHSSTAISSTVIMSARRGTPSARSCAASCAMGGTSRPILRISSSFETHRGARPRGRRFPRPSPARGPRAGPRP